MKNLIKRALERFGIGRVLPGQIVVTTRQLNNILYYADVFKLIDGVQGSVVECGVGKGRSFLYLSYLIQKEGKSRLLWGFDSFEGFPEPAPEDAGERNPQKGEWSDGINIARIRNVLTVAGIGEQWIQTNVRLVKGFFNESLGTYDGAPIALLHVDADLYQSYMDVLRELFPKVAKNGVVLFDEYNEAAWPGAKKAVDEFFRDMPYEIKRHPSGKYYLIKS